LFKNPSSADDIAPAEEEIREAIESAACFHKQLEHFEQSMEAHKFAASLGLYGKEAITFSYDNRSCVLGYCKECHSAVVRVAPESKKRPLNDSSGTVCHLCQDDMMNERRREANKKHKHTDASDHTTFKNLNMSPEKTRMKGRFNSRKRQVRTKHQHIKRLEAMMAKLNSEQSQVKAKLPLPKDDDNPGAIMGVLGKLIELIEEDDKGSKDDKERKHKVRDEIILAMLNDALDDTEKDSPYDVEEARRFVVGIREEIEKYAMVLTGKEKQIRFSPQVFQVAMKIWMRSPATYEELRNAQWIVKLPSQSRLRDLRNETKVEDGESIALYARLAANRKNHSEVLVGLIMCDEMKLDENVIWHTKTHEVVGFAGDFESLDNVVRNILSGNTHKQPAVEVNQWKYRAINGGGVSFECEFFYNGGNLSNADLRRQFLQVTSCLELINCQVWGWVADGASKNVTAMKIISEMNGATLVPAEGWVAEEYISLIHPIDPTRRLFLWLCSTHQLKSIRNQLWTSRNSGKRSFVSADGYPFGWDLLKEQLDRDKTRGSPHTHLTDASLLLDGWAKMSVAFAKAPFRERTVCEALGHICYLADVPLPKGDEMIYESNKACCRPLLWTPFGAKRHNKLIGMLTVRVAEAKAAIIAKKDELDNAFPSIMSKVALLEYQCVTQDLFVDVYMNAELHFCRENINPLKKFIQSKMNYFKNWYDAMAKRQETSADLTFLASTTWTNLRIQVCGFIGFAEHVLNKVSEQDVKYIPMLLSNTSNLESTFSHVRSLGGRDAQSYKTRIASRSNSRSIDAVRRSSSYSESETLPE
jgi:hypothetical protein